MFSLTLYISAYFSLPSSSRRSESFLICFFASLLYKKPCFLSISGSVLVLFLIWKVITGIFHISLKSRLLLLTFRLHSHIFYAPYSLLFIGQNVKNLQKWEMANLFSEFFKGKVEDLEDNSRYLNFEVPELGDLIVEK